MIIVYFYINPNMTDSSDSPRIRLLLEIECSGREAAQAADLFDSFRWMAESLYPHAAIRARRLTFPSSGEARADAVINPLPRKYGAPPSARPGPGFEPVVIREGDERRCRCGHCWTGPAKRTPTPGAISGTVRGA